MIINNLFEGKGKDQRTEARNHAEDLKKMFMGLKFHEEDITVEENLKSKVRPRTISSLTHHECILTLTLLLPVAHKPCMYFYLFDRTLEL